MLDVLDATGRDIAELGDNDLRELVARLCEATMRRLGLPATAVTWGGDQDAADGGVDVRVELPAGTAIEGFVPRPATVLQSKRPGMAAAAIDREMRPGGVLRPAIAELASRGGAYVIVSSGSSTSDSGLRTRAAAMRAAVAHLPHADRLALDFYDRRRMATAVNGFPGLVL